MSFLKNALSGNNRFSGYLLTVCLVVLGYVVLGQIPMLIHASLLLSGDEMVRGDVRALSEIFGENLFLVYLIIPFITVLITLLLSVRMIHHRPVLSLLTARERFDWKRFILALAVWGTILIFFLILQLKSSDQIEWNMNPRTIVPLVLISILLIPLQTTAEEVLFRGYLFQAFGIRNKGWVVVLITGVLFGLVHGANPEVDKLGLGLLSYYILTGVFLGLITLFDDGLELSIGYHAVNNIFAALILTNDWQAFQTDALFIDHSQPEFGWDAILTILVIQPLILLLFHKIYKWQGIREKLIS